jgi:hypothetical protein
VKEFNSAAGTDLPNHIDSENILLPKPGHDLFALTRLLYQSLVMIRFAVADGQHRLLSMSSVLLGFEIRDSLSKDPPIYFEKKTMNQPVNLEAMEGLCTIRLVYSYCQPMQSVTAAAAQAKKVKLFKDIFESKGNYYSRQRDTSQSAKRSRTLCDV